MGNLVSHSQKYLFDLNNFDTGGGLNADTPPAPVFSESELADARAQGFAEGEKKGHADGLASRDQQIVTLTQKLTQDMAQLFAAEQERTQRFEQDVLRLTKSVLAQAFPVFNRYMGPEQLEKTIRDVMTSLEESSSVVIEVAPTDQDELSQRLKSFLAQHVGHVSILPHSDMTAGSFRMRWKDGGAIRDIDKLSRDIFEALARTLAEIEQKTHTS